MKIILVSVMLSLGLVSHGQDISRWNQWQWLLGEWKGEGAGKPGQGEGVFAFEPKLDGQVLQRTSRTEFPSSPQRAAFVHSDLLYVYFDANKNPSKAIYFDNEGHTLNYSVSVSDSCIVFVSEKLSNQPIFRLSYTKIDSETVNTKFEISMDGVAFKNYLSGNSKRIH